MWDTSGPSLTTGRMRRCEYFGSFMKVDGESTIDIDVPRSLSNAHVPQDGGLQSSGHSRKLLSE